MRKQLLALGTMLVATGWANATAQGPDLVQPASLVGEHALDLAAPIKSEGKEVLTFPQSLPSFYGSLGIFQTNI